MESTIMKQFDLPFPNPVIRSTPKILLRAEITYYQTYYKDDDDEYGGGFGPRPAHKRYKTKTVICGIVSSEEDGREVISRVDPAKDFHDYAWTIDKVEYYFQPVSYYEVTNA